MKKIILLTDYLNRFGSKHDDFPYRSGMDKDKLERYFSKSGYNAVLMNFSDVELRNDEFKGKTVLYTSQEDPGYYYKDFIEDIVYDLELSGARVIPSYKYLRANNNKVFMEILRDQSELKEFQNVTTYKFGTLEEAVSKAAQFKFPVVVKAATGAMGKNVALANNKKELYRILKRIAATRNLKEEFREFIRSLKYQGYKKQSKFRRKFIIQSFIPGLKNDWKVYVFGKKVFVFYRPIFKHRGFRASGGGYDNYFYGKQAKIPDGLFDYAYKIFEALDTPFVSLDICYKNNQFYLLEFQCIYFGTAGILQRYSTEYFFKENNQWVEKPNEGDIEKVYVEAIVEYLNK